MNKLCVNLVDIFQRQIFPAEIVIESGKIKSIVPTKDPCEHYALPGFIDAHVHIESSMLVPSEFSRLAIPHGTVATVSDPHEIANVCGMAGVEYMIQNANKVPFHFFFGAPSCVPATHFETAGDTLDSTTIEQLLQRDDIYYLSEMMNYPGVLFKEEEVMKKISLAKKYQKPIDGHAPGLRGEKAKQYIAAGISTDHECFTLEEALEKINLGMKILIREGSAAKNFEALYPLIDQFPDQVMFCCDDKHPDELVLHHINHHVQRALLKGCDLFHVLKAACINPVFHYQLPVGLLRVGDPADFIVVKNLQQFELLQSYHQGQCVFNQSQLVFDPEIETTINRFHVKKKIAKDFEVLHTEGTEFIRVIEALEGQLITKTMRMKPHVENGCIVSDTNQDILKIVVVNRYRNEKPAVGFIHHFNLKKGAIASTVAHDSHNIICVGTHDEDITRAVNHLIEREGGVVAVHENEVQLLPLPVAGLMSNQKAEKVAELYSLVDQKAKALGSTLQAPFMTLSFMALLVIPQLKLSDQGLFDGDRFEFVDMQG